MVHLNGNEGGILYPDTGVYSNGAGGFGSSTLNHAAYIVGNTSSVKIVAMTSPLAMATAIGPQKLLRIKGTMPKIAAAAVSMIGRNLSTAESMIASQRCSPFSACFCI